MCNQLKKYLNKKVATKKLHTSKKMRSILWLFASVCCIILLVSAVYYKDNRKCKGVAIEIVGNNLNDFVNKNDIYNVVKKYGGDTTSNNPIASVNLKLIEKELEKIIWIQDAELFFDNNNILKISVKESMPLARVFTISGNSFYMDSACKLLPISSIFSGRMPVFTGFGRTDTILSKNDTAILNDIKLISLKIIKDSFLMAMVEQVNILPENKYELVPKIGNQIIILGEAKNVDSKLEKLKLFYKKVTPVVGWNKYSKINLEYENQIVASVKGVEEVYSDSIRTLELMKTVAENAARKSSDSTQIFASDNVTKTDSKLIDNSAEREDEGEDGNVNTIKVKRPKLQIAKPTVPASTTIKKPVVKPNVTPKIIKPPIKPSVVKPLAAKPIIKPKTSAPKPNAKPVTKPKK